MVMKMISASLRVRRETRGTESLLTVEWEGIQTGDHPDTDVKGFLVEYRAEKDKHWMVHSGIIPYKGPNHQYRVQIPKLPTGVAYFVRIKVLGAHNEILVETAEIRARNEIVSIKCESDDLTAPRHLEVTHEGQYSLAIKWDAPECGSIGEYQVELIGDESPFDVHRQTVTHPTVSVTNLLPSTTYTVKIRAVDRQRRIGPWNADLLQAKTQGNREHCACLYWNPTCLQNRLGSSDFMGSHRRRTSSALRGMRTSPCLLPNLTILIQVMAVEVLPESRRVERARVPPYVSGHTLSGLLPETKYLIGVVAFVDHEPKQALLQVYNLEAETGSSSELESWQEKPQVIDDGSRHFTVRWQLPPVEKAVNKFVVEFRLPNETSWRSSDTTNVEGGTKEFSVVLPNMADTSLYTVRVVAIGPDEEVVSRTEEVTVGAAAANACVGPAGVPEDIHESDQMAPHSGASYIGGTAVAIPDLRPSTKYSFRVRSRNANGHSPWSESIHVATETEGAAIDFKDLTITNIKAETWGRRRRQAKQSITAGVEQQPRFQVSIAQPRIEQQGSRNVAYWSTSGDTSQLLGYQVDIRRDGDRDWHEQGAIVRSEPSQTHFRQSLGAVPVATYYLRVRAVDTSMATVATSPSTSFSVSCQAPVSPENVRLDRVSDEIVRISWTFPSEDPACQTFFFITGVQNGIPVNYRVPGTERSYDITGPARGDWRVEVRAVNAAGSGPASRQAVFTSAQQCEYERQTPKRHHRSICDPRTDFWCRTDSQPQYLQVEAGALVSAPRVTARGNDLHVEWTSEGDGRGVFGYRLQFRSESSGWNPYGQVVPYVGDNQQYSQTLTGLQKGHTYSVHIQVLDRNSYVMYVSPEASARSSCTAPSHPPSHLQLQAPDASHVRVHWALPPQSTWGCADIQYEIQVVEPRGVASVTVAGGQTNHIFQSQPNQQWSVRIRAINSAGHSPWTPTAEARTPPGGELIVGPNVAYRQGNPIVTWQARENVEDLIESFSLEEYLLQIPFSGWQRPYTIDLGELPKGHTYQVRIVVRDMNRGTAFTSPIVQVQTRSTCQPPRRAPSNLQVSPIGPTQIRLTWAPLHESEWNCDRLWYIVKYSTPKNQGFKNLTQGENSVVFESDPYTKWNFEVQAANPAGETQWSRMETAQTQDASPGPVVDLRVQAVGPDRLQVSWRPPINPNGLITQYEVTYQLISKGMCDQQQDVPRTISVTSPHHVITGLHPHSRYRVGVAARTTIAGERVSQEVQTDQSVPAAPPVYLRVDEAKETDASFSWQAPPCLQTNGEITEYEYEVTPADRRAAQQKIANTVRGTRVQATNLQPYTRYNVKVRAYTARGAGPWSTEVPFQTAAAQIVTAPPFVRVINTGADNAHLVWQSPDPSSGYVDKYRCRYSPSGTQEFQERQFPAVSPCQARMLERQQLPTTAPGTKLHCGRIDNLKPQQTYDFQVAAHVRDAGWSPWSQPERTKITDEAVQVLTIDKIGGTESSLAISWTVRPTDRSRVTSFRLHVEPVDGSSRAQTFNVDRATYQYRIDGLRPRTQYNVTVQAATDKELCGGTTTTMWTDAAPLTALAVAPRVVAEEATSVTIEWDSRNKEAAGFIVEYRCVEVEVSDNALTTTSRDYRLEGGAWQQHPRRIPAHPSHSTYSATVDGLPTNNVVDLRVRVTSHQNEQSNPSPEVRARTKCSPPSNPPQGIRVDAPSTNDVRVSWSRPAKDTWMCDQMNVEISYRIGNEPEKVNPNIYDRYHFFSRAHFTVQILPVPGGQTEYTFPAEPNQRWIIKLRATNQVGSSRWSAEQTVTTRQGAPGAVRDLRVKALSPNEVHVQWLAPLVQRGTIVGYDISYRLKHRLACPEEEPRDVSRDFVTVYNHKDLDYTITGLLPYSLYEVRVRARTTELGPEETKEVSTDQQPPSSPPLNLELTYALERSLSFQWEPVDCSQRHGHIVNYEYEILGQDDWAKLERQIANTSDTRITIDGLTPFTKYVMRVRAYNSIGGGPNTENLDVMTAKASAPLPPQDLVVAQEGTDFFMVSWLPPYPPYGPHDAYKIRYQLLGTDRWTEKQHGVKEEALQCPSESPRFCFNATGLEPGNQYKVQVATRIEGGSYGPWSSVVIANTLQILPDAPIAIHLIDKTDHSLHIRWVPPTDPKGHITQYRVSIVSLDDPHDERKTHLVDHSTLTYLFENLKPETSYNVSIAAGSKRGFGREIWTRYSTDPFVIPIVVAAPVVTPDGASALDIQWGGVTDSQNRVKGYIIEIRNSDTPVWQEIGGVTPHDPVKRTYLKKLTGLDADTLYFVRVKVVDDKQRVGAASPEAQGRTGCAPPTAPPSNVNLASPSNVQVRVSWQAPVKGSWLCSNIRYKLEYINGTQPRQQIDLPSSSIEHLFDSPSNTKWQVRIRTENDAGVSGWSNELELTTAEGAPGPVTDLNAIPTGPTSIEVSWRPPVNPNGVITGYTLVYNLKSMGECGPRSSTPIQKHVRNNAVGEGPFSEWTRFTTHPAAPPAPSGLQEEGAFPHAVEISFEAPSPPHGNLDYYRIRHTPSGQMNFKEVRVEAERLQCSDASKRDRLCFRVHDLDPEQDYQIEVAAHTEGGAWSDWIRVRADNAVGEGPFSEWTRFTTHPAAPPAPSGLQEEGAFPHAVEISFEAPSPPHGNLDYYRIRHTPSGQMNFKEVRVEAERLQCSDASKRDRLCFRVHDLDPEQDYQIEVAAHTEGGAWSDWSEPLTARTEQQNLPLFTQYLVDNAFQAAHVVGYVLEFKSEDDDDWAEYNGVIKHRRTSTDYKVNVRNLETATNYFFRLKVSWNTVVGKNDKRGAPGPETKAMTSCGRPEEPPSNVKLESVDFQTMKITWIPPAEESWRCDDVEFIIDYVNTTSRGSWSVPVDSPSEMIVPTMPGTRWEVKMKTQTVEDGGKPQSSRWSDKVTLTTQSLPGELFVTVEPKGPREALVTWDLPDKDQKWNYGVDISYRLKQLGGCNEAATGSHEPITKLNIQEKQVLLEELAPGSVYEVTVTPRRPPSLHSSIVAPKTVRTFKTKNDVPTGPPLNLQSTVRKDTELGFKWDAPECVHQNGNVSQYEFELVGMDEWNEGTREGVTPRTNTIIDQLQPGSLYRMKVRAYTAEGPGPWSDPLEIRTTGSELGPPRELTAVQTKSTAIQLTWLPPYPEKAIVTAYRIRYSPRADDSNPTEFELSGDELSCVGYKSPIITTANLVTIAPFDPRTGVTGPKKNYTVPVPGNSIKFEGLTPETVYNITVQAGTNSGYGHVLWGTYSTLAPGQRHIIRLINRTPTTLHVEWEPVWGRSHSGYVLTARSLHSVYSNVRINQVKTFEVEPWESDFVIRGLHPSTVYNVTLKPKDQNEVAWGAYATLPPGWFLVKNLKQCDKTNFAVSMSWEPVELNMASHYQLFSCRASIASIASVVNLVLTFSSLPQSKERLFKCLQFFIAIKDSRYYVVVDERDPPGESNWTELTDKVTANKLKIPYYVAASYDINTLTEPRKVRIGDGTVIGGYLNYPLVKGKKYNYEVYTVWNVTGVPVVGRSREFALTSLLSRFWNRKGPVANAHLLKQEERLDLGPSSSDLNVLYSHGNYGAVKDDGNSGIFGDRVTPSLISRLDEQYPGQDDFKQGYVDGFKEGAASRTGERRTFEDSRRLQQSLTELTERLTSLEKTKGDEIHSTKIYHVYNQQPDTLAYASSGQQLAQELEEISSTSRRSTLRRHYTPGDYLKYASEGDGYGTLGRNRRSLSASALARDSAAFESRTAEQRSRHASGTGSSYITRGMADRQGTDTYSKRYNYRSRSDVGSPRRYASQTLLDGSRPGPSTPHARRDALSTLQRELDTLSRSPDRSTPRGYTSDTAYDTVRSKARGYSNYDYVFPSLPMIAYEYRVVSFTSCHGFGYTAIPSRACLADWELAASYNLFSTVFSSAMAFDPTQVTADTFSSSRHHETRTSTVGGAGAGGVSTHTARPAGKDSADDAGRWADDLLEIVSEPMNKTLDRMKKYSSSSANVEAGPSTSHGDAKEIVEEKYHRSYKEEHSSGGR
ncbi:fibronectin type III domain protein [Necator americanus]|uniref:Fibronectin type III domain protein n=1 Tax=Necator americanus TaxID=51031 RepID=W2SRK4_NECAM|nr:fibronectin type III domain protein [Necator americanus]ETN71312.1 fibronectin type III domain protein [Necator americanus]